MNDERKILYENYVSDYKSITSDFSELSIKSLYAHYDTKVLPHILKLGKEAKVLELGCGPGFALLKMN
jgi:hypothetical protein